MAELRRNMKCSNCGKKGHSQRRCMSPIISIGIAAITWDPFEARIKYLLVQRRNTIGFIELVKGKTMDDPDIIRKLFRDMTDFERQSMINRPFCVLWRMACGYGYNISRINYDESQTKFRNLCRGIKYPNGETISLGKLFHEIPEFSEEPEWSFPKGKRKKSSEADINCAKREFGEETNYIEDDYQILDDLEPIREELVGMDGRIYRYIYFLAVMKTPKGPYIDPNNSYQIGEIGDIGWFSYEDTIEKMIARYPHRRKMMKRINQIVNSIQVMKYLNPPRQNYNPFSILETLNIPQYLTPETNNPGETYERVETSVEVDPGRNVREEI